MRTACLNNHTKRGKCRAPAQVNTARQAPPNQINSTNSGTVQPRRERAFHLRHDVGVRERERRVAAGRLLRPVLPQRRLVQLRLRMARPTPPVSRAMKRSSGVALFQDERTNIPDTQQ